MRYFYIFLSLFFYAYLSSQITFVYDSSGNQILREFKVSKSNFFAKKGEYQKTNIYPNPVSAELNIIWESSISNLIFRIELVSYNGTKIEEVKFIPSEGRVSFNMSHKLFGVYYLKIFLSDGEVYSHTLIKN